MKNLAAIFWAFRGSIFCLIGFALGCANGPAQRTIVGYEIDWSDGLHQTGAADAVKIRRIERDANGRDVLTEVK